MLSMLAFMDASSFFEIAGDHDASLVKSITKQEIISLFMSRIHQSSSSRAKMSVHLRSQKPRPKKIGLVAMEAFENTLIEQGIKVNGQKWREELTGDGEPLLSQFTKYWEDTLPVQDPSLTPETLEQIMGCVPALLEQYPADGDYEGKIKDGVHFIEDPKAFKASLRRADPPRPLVQWDDLPMSKY